MGEVVFSPLYEVLKKRGVHFRFFEMVTHLSLSDSGTQITGIRLEKALRVEGEYQPLEIINGVPCWRKHADPAQTSPWPTTTDADERQEELLWGRDFDLVILAIPAGALEPICSELVQTHPRWKDMIAHLPTTATASCQAWLNCPVESVGWGGPNPEKGPVVGAFSGLFDTWADMTHTLAHEGFDAEGGPKQVAYFCAPYPNPPEPSRAAASQRLAEQTRTFFERDLKPLWPNLYTDRGEFQWEELWDGAGQQGARRLNAQYIRANVEPSERYVQSHAGTLKYRMKPGESGIKNLFLAGDWTDNGINIGCVEATVISGELCAEAMKPWCLSNPLRSRRHELEFETGGPR
ncbi:MAG: hypothetical protein IPK82_22405 [Polyangiaceae bacterium]|nr:hypothetical protein [Polyangiaceae bacterium]